MKYRLAVLLATLMTFSVVSLAGAEFGPMNPFIDPQGFTVSMH